MEGEDREYTVAIDSSEDCGLALGEIDEPPKQYKEENEDGCGTDETLFLAYGAEDEISLLFGNVLELGLGAVEESLAGETARADSYLGLDLVVAHAVGVVAQSEQDLYAFLLMGWHVVHDGTGGEVYGEGGDSEEGDVEVAFLA